MARQRIRLRSRNPLGERAVWGRVGYSGEPFAPPLAAYPEADPRRLAWTTLHDSGAHPRSGPRLANLYPLIAAALAEASFAREAGPLTSWSN